MVKPTLQTGSIVDGFRIGDRVHDGGLATLWSVSHPGATMPMLMKVPKFGEGEDPAAIVSFEMEQMILPRLSGVHVPKFVAVGDFAVQPYIIMERIDSPTLLARVPDIPLPYADVAEIGVKLATALDDLHRQHVIHLDVKPSNVMFRSAGEAVLLEFGLSHHDQLPDLMQVEFRLPFGTAPYGAGAAPRRPERSQKRPVCSGCLAVLLLHRRAAVRGKRDAARDAPAALARPAAAAAIDAGLSALAAGNRAALHRDRACLALPHGGATGLRVEPSE